MLKMASSRVLPFILIVGSLMAGGANPAKAVLTYNNYESSGNLIIETEGSLSALGVAGGTDECGTDGAVYLLSAFICTGPDAIINKYAISGPGSLAGNDALFFPASAVSGISTALDGPSSFFIASSYVVGQPIVSKATFNGKTLASLGLTASSGSLGTWTLNGTSESINVQVFNPVPGPLPVLGAGAAFGFCRRLRRRVNADRSLAQN